MKKSFLAVLSIIMSVVMLCASAIGVFAGSSDVESEIVEVPQYTAYPLYDSEGHYTKGVEFYVSGLPFPESEIISRIGKGYDNGARYLVDGLDKLIIWSGAAHYQFTTGPRFCKDSSARIYFSGTAIKLFSNYYNASFAAPTVKVDGVAASCNISSASPNSDTVITEVTGLSDSLHFVEIVANGDVEIDSFAICGELADVPEYTAYPLIKSDLSFNKGVQFIGWNGKLSSSDGITEGNGYYLRDRDAGIGYHKYAKVVAQRPGSQVKIYFKGTAIRLVSSNSWVTDKVPSVIIDGVSYSTVAMPSSGVVFFEVIGLNDGGHEVTVIGTGENQIGLATWDYFEIDGELIDVPTYTAYPLFNTNWETSVGVRFYEYNGELLPVGNTGIAYAWDSAAVSSKFGTCIGQRASQKFEIYFIGTAINLCSSFYGQFVSTPAVKIDGAEVAILESRINGTPFVSVFGLENKLHKVEVSIADAVESSLISWDYFEIDGTLVSGDPSFDEVSVSVGKDLSINYFANVYDDSVYTVKFTYNEKESVVEALPVDGSNTLMFKFTGVNPQCMGDNVKAELLRDGEVVDTKESFSVKDYCIGLVAKDADYTEICSALLNYGAEAQKYQNYKTDALCTVGVEWFSAPEDIAVENAVRTITKNSGDTTLIKSASLVLGNTNKIMFKIVTDYTSVKLGCGDDLVDVTSDVEIKNGFGYVYTDDLLVTQNATVFTLVVESADAKTTVQYNVNAYVSAKAGDETVGNLAKALYALGEIGQSYVN